MYCDKVTKDEQGEETVCGGPVKPCITFFGQALPDKFNTACDKIRNIGRDERYNEMDARDQTPLFEDGGCDLVIVIGTALAVNPFASAILEAHVECPKVLINLENTAENGYDFLNPIEFPERIFIKGKCDDTIQ